MIVSVSGNWDWSLSFQKVARFPGPLATVPSGAVAVTATGNTPLAAPAGSG